MKAKLPFRSIAFRKNSLQITKRTQTQSSTPQTSKKKKKVSRSQSVDNRKSNGLKTLKKMLESQYEELKIRKIRTKQSKMSGSTSRKLKLLEKRLLDQESQNLELQKSLIQIRKLTNTNNLTRSKNENEIGKEELGKEEENDNEKENENELSKEKEIENEKEKKKEKQLEKENGIEAKREKKEEHEKEKEKKNESEVSEKYPFQKKIICDLEKNLIEIKNSKKQKKLQNLIGNKQEKLKEWINKNNQLLIELQHTRLVYETEKKTTERYFDKMGTNKEGIEKLMIQELTLRKLKDVVKQKKFKIKKVRFKLEKINNPKTKYFSNKMKLRNLFYKSRLGIKENKYLNEQIEKLSFIIENSEEFSDLSSIESSFKKHAEKKKKKTNQIDFFQKLNKDEINEYGENSNDDISDNGNENSTGSEREKEGEIEKEKEKEKEKENKNNNKNENENVNVNENLKNFNQNLNRSDESILLINKVSLSRSRSDNHLFQEQNNFHENRKFQNKLKSNSNEILNKNTGIESLEIFLRIPIGIIFFKEYLSEKVNQENILFFEEIKEFKHTCRTFKKIKKESKMIYQKFIKPGALFEINLSSGCKKKILRNFEQKKFTIDIYDEAQQQVFDHMNLNWWDSFQKTIYYQQFQKEFLNNPSFQKSLNNKKFYLLYQPKQYSQSLNEEFTFKGKTRNIDALGEELIISIIDIFQTYFQNNRKRINLKMISKSIPFRKFVKQTAQLQKFRLTKNTTYEQKFSFFINLYNTLVLHSFIINDIPKDKNSLKKFLKNSVYKLNGQYWSLNDIYHGILRSNKKRNKGSNFYFKIDDINKSKFALKKIDPRVHFCLINNDVPSFINIITSQNFDEKLSQSTNFVLSSKIKIIRKTIFLPRVFSIYLNDFGGSENLFNWLKANLNGNFKLDNKLNYTYKFMPNNNNISKISFDFNRTLLQRFWKSQID
ncbi:electron carrier/ protein disulfide oxidoreductase [Anaeramoeba flamelloides]|uniref:Electron carrier/ protein disulfide oxidoreductase n=1 Tax=Anaeramoeba flamelloides TaxID=1746091 RepID=A0AAV8A234_9EUKA|nr:electron carrier/ protein disulfide oxidoreductase [Anaeramoeba flamelloides]